MKIAISTFTFYPELNGVANVSYKQAEYFQGLGYEVHIITRKNLDRNFEDEKIKNFIFHEFDVKGNPLLYNLYRGEVFKYIDFLENFKCDAIIFHAWQIWTTDLFYFTNKKKTHYKTIMVSHCTGIKTKNTLRDKLNYFLFLPYRYIMKQLIKRFDQIVLLSDKEDEDRFYDVKMIKKMKLLDKCKVIPNGLDIQSFEIKTVEKLLDVYKLKYKEYIICISNYQDIKNQMETLKIYEKFEKEVDIVFIGDYDSEYLDKLKTYAQSLKYSKNIKFLVNLEQNDLKKLLYGAKVFLFSSKSECMPLVVLESVGSYVPVISSNVGNVETIKGVRCYKSIYEASTLLENLYFNQVEYKKIESEIKVNVSEYTWESVMSNYIYLIGSK